MESVLQTEDDGQLWDTLVATELVECSNQENLGSVEEVLKAVPVTESVLFQVQNSNGIDGCHDGNRMKEVRQSQCKMFRFTSKQTKILNQQFFSDPYPSPYHRRYMAYQLQVPEKSIMNWFVNRRYILRKNVGLNQGLFSQQDTLNRNSTPNSSGHTMKKSGSLKKTGCILNFTKNQSSVQSPPFKPWRPWITPKRE